MNYDKKLYFQGALYDSELRCPLTHKNIKMVACTDFGNFYEYGAIKDWLKDYDTDPLTNEKLPCRHIWYLGTLNKSAGDGLILIKAQRKAEYLRQRPYKCYRPHPHNCNELNL